MKKLSPEFNTVTLTRKEIFAIELTGIPGAGYLWDVQIKSGDARLLTTRNVLPPNSGIGGSVKQVFTFVADKPGTIELEAEYKRPWEAKAEKTCLFSVKVK